MNRFIINDESKINSHGFRLMNEGARLERYKANPVVLSEHDPGLPIGIGKDVKTDGDTMSFEAEFDMSDPVAARVAGKVEKGHLRGCSPGIIVHGSEYIQDASGREECRVTDWELFEISIVSVPSNAGALKLYNSDLKEMSVADVFALAAEPSDNPNPKNKNNTMKIILTLEAAQALALTTHEIEDGKQLSAAIMELAAKLTQAEKNLKEATDKLDAQAEAQALALVEAAINSGRIQASAKEQFLTLAKTNFELCKSTLEAIPVRRSLSAQLSNAGSAMESIPADRAGWSYLRWLKEDPAGLEKLRADDPEAFEKLKNKKR